MDRSPQNKMVDDSQATALKRVLDTVMDLTRRQVSSVVIFDLDATLLDNRPRTYYILREIAENFDEETPQLRVALWTWFITPSETP